MPSCLRRLLEAEAVILPGTLAVADEVTAGGVKSQRGLRLYPAHIAVVPPEQVSRASFSFTTPSVPLLTLVDAKRFPGRPGMELRLALVTSFSLGVWEVNSLLLYHFFYRRKILWFDWVVAHLVAD